MKIKQTVTAKYNGARVGWHLLEFAQDNGDEVQIQMTDDDYLELYDTIKGKADRIRKDRAAEAEELAKENESE